MNTNMIGESRKESNMKRLESGASRFMPMLGARGSQLT